MRDGSWGRVRTALPALALVACGWPVAASAQTAVQPEVVSLSLRGNEVFSDAELEAVIRTRETECVTLLLTPFCWLTDWGFAHRRGLLDSLDVAGDELRLRGYYALRGYFSADVRSTIRSTAEEARVQFDITEGEPTVIDSFAIRGLPPSVGLAQASRLVGIGEGDRFDQIALEAGKDSLVRVMRERGYIEAAIFQDAQRRVGGPARVTLDVSPGSRYRIGRVRVSGAEEIGEGVVRDLLAIGPGQYYSQTRVEDSQRNLFALDAVRFASIQPCRAGAGGEAVPGDAAATDSIAGAVEDACPGLAGGASAADSVVDLQVTITPAPTRAARGGIGGSTDECLQTEARLTHRNFLGGAKRLEVTARLKNIFAQQLDGSFPCTDVGTDSDFRTLNFLLQAQLTVPVFFSGRNSFRSSLFGERETVPDVFIREGVGAELAVTRRLRRQMTATLTYRPEFTGFDPQSADIFFCVNFGFCTPEDIGTITEARWLSPLALSWVYNRTNRPLQPTDGYYLSADVEAAGPLTFSDYPYVRLTLSGAHFAEIEPGLVFAARARGGLVEPSRGAFFLPDDSPETEVVHPSKRFFAGGSQSVRGFGQNLLGPRVLVASLLEDCPNEAIEICVQRLAAEDPGAFDQRPSGGNAALEVSLELRQRLSSRWGFVLFLDGGDVWRDLSSLDAPVWTPGAGIRFMSPIGPLRLDLGYDPTGTARLPVIVTLDNGTLIELDDPVLFDPFAHDDPSLLKEVLRRLQLHISIGEAF